MLKGSSRLLNRSGARLTYPQSDQAPRIQALPRLSLKTLDRVPSRIRRPAFDVAAVRPGILHLGCGAFHRAHQAVFTQRAIEAEGTGRPSRWGIIGASLVRPRMRDALTPQDGLYTVLERGRDGVRAELIGAVRQVIFGPDDPAALPAYIADPAISIVTLTVTPSGYCLDGATGRLCPSNPQIQSDLARRVPRSALGVLVNGLDQVRRAGRRPPVIMSCDNLPANGRTLRQATIDHAGLYDDALSNWIAGSVQFPCSMVDRIVPTSTETDEADAAEMLGLVDRAPLSAEPFRQWVIEDFEGPRPLWEAAGAEFVADVTPWETAKLRLLNGTHMAIAYLGALAGLDTVSAVVKEPLFASYALRFMLQEQMPTLPPSGLDIVTYAHRLLERWRNPGIAHQLSRVGRNGSEKLQPRLLASVRENLEAGRAAPCTTLAVAAWICCVSGAGGRNRRADIEDPIRARMQALGQAARHDPQGLARATLELAEVFGEDLVTTDAFRSGLSRSVASLHSDGPRGAIAALMI